jgi:hypothetical protein
MASCFRFIYYVCYFSRNLTKGMFLLRFTLLFKVSLFKKKVYRLLRKLCNSMNCLHVP